MVPWKVAKESIIQASEVHPEMFSLDELLEPLKELKSPCIRSTQENTDEKSNRYQSFVVTSKYFRMSAIGNLAKDKAQTMDMGKTFCL